MRDMQRLQAERRVQPSFTRSRLFSGLVIAGLVVAAHSLLARLPDRDERADARADIHFTPVKLARDAALPLRVAGAWRLTSTEPRLGGVSALAIDRGQLIALTDAGVVIRLPRPGRGRVAEFRDLPDGPGRARYKAGRDSEALARDAAGRGWWVAFENRHSIWLFNHDFTRVERRIGLGGLGWRANMGAEGALSRPGGLVLLPESGDELVRIGPADAIERIDLVNPYGRLADVTTLPDGRIVVLARSFSPAGFSSRLLLLEGMRLTPIATLRLGRLDNPEALAAETMPGGVTRIWLMTDNDFRRRVPTLLIALDWAD